MDDRELRSEVRRASAGDEGAAGALFDRYYPRLFRYALARLGRPADAEDVAAETFARVLRDIDRFRWRGAGFEAWLFRIASNLVVDHARRGAREDPRAETTGELERLDISAEDVAIQRNDALLVRSLLEHLSDDQREVLILRFVAGLDSEEAGRVMGRKPNAIRQLQFRALGNLRQFMRGETP